MVARSGERSRSHVAAPLALRPFLEFTRLDDRVGAAVLKALRGDDAFRSRVREAVVVATGGEAEAEEEVGEAGWLLLDGAGSSEGADGEKLAELLEEAVTRRQADEEARDEKRADRRREQAESALSRLREELADERRRADDQAATVDELTGRVLALATELEAARADVNRLAADRAEAVRQLEDARHKVEERAAERRELRRDAAVARDESASMRIELAHLREEVESLRSLPRFPPATADPGDASTDDDDTGREGGGSLGEHDRQELARAIAEAAAAASVLGSALERASRTFADGADEALPGSPGASSAGAGSGSASTGTGGATGAPGSAAATAAVDGGRGGDVPGPGSTPVPARRLAARLPVGMFDDSAEAADHLVRLPGAVLVVDGYNVSMAAWPEQTLAQQRRNLVERLRNLHARIGVDPVAVFDGADVGGGPTGSLPRSVQVRFSPPGITADDVVVEMVERYPNDRAVLVATSDRELRERSSAIGANLISAPQLIALLGAEAR